MKAMSDEKGEFEHNSDLPHTAPRQEPLDPVQYVSHILVICQDGCVHSHDSLCAAVCMRDLGPHQGTTA